MALTRENVLTFIAGVVATAAVWWITERMLDRHIGPKLGTRGEI